MEEVSKSQLMLLQLHSLHLLEDSLRELGKPMSLITETLRRTTSHPPMSISIMLPRILTYSMLLKVTIFLSITLKPFKKSSTSFIQMVMVVSSHGNSLAIPMILNL
jgi:hypothetical protein